MSTFDRFKGAIAGVLAELLPERAFLAPAEYRVKKAEGGKFSGSPLNPARGLPPAVDWPIRGSIVGGHTGGKLTAGTVVLVIFADADPSKPCVVGIADDSEPDEIALEASAVSINGGGPTQGAARFGDSVLAGPFAGTITTASATVKVGG